MSGNIPQHVDYFNQNHKDPMSELNKHAQTNYNMQKQSQNNITDSPNPNVSRHQQTRKQRQSLAFIAMSTLCNILIATFTINNTSCTANN